MAAPQEAHQEEHESFIKTPKQLAWIMLLAFVVPVLGMIMLAQLVYTASRGASDQASLADEAVRARIRPVAWEALQVTATAPTPGSAVARSGEEVYKSACAACHGAGVAGAPKFGDKAAWAPHIKQGLDALTHNAINGIRGMPARGGNQSLSDFEVARAVVYMANAGGASFKEPAAPAAAAAAAPPSKRSERSGEEIIKAACGSCHYTGEGGAPKIGDKAAWSTRISAGLDTVIASAIKGHGGMPARGGIADLTDPEVKKAIVYMFNSAGAKEIPSASATAAVAVAAAAAGASAAPAAADAGKGKATYDQVCMACHMTGAAGAPKLGDKDAWGPRIKAGTDTLYQAVINGKGAMPAKGGRADVSDADVKAAVDYMVAAAK